MRIGALLALTVATFSLGFGELMIAGILPVIAADLHVTLPVAGQLVGAYALTFAVLSPPLVVLVQNIDRRTALVAALLVVAAANAGAAAGNGFAVVLGMRIIAAAGSAVATTLALATVDSVSTAATRGRAHGIVFAGFSAAATLGVPLSTLIADRFGWRYAFGGVALSALVAALLVAVVIERMPRGAPIAWHDLMRVVARRPLLLTITVSLLNLTAQYLVFTYVRPYLEAAGGYGGPTVAWLLLLFGAFGIAGNLAGGALVDRRGSYGTMLACLVATFAVYLVFRSTGTSVFAASLIFAVWALGSWGFAPAVNRRLGDDARSAPEIGLALNLTAFNLGIALGSAAGGVVIALSGPLALPYAGAAILVVAIIVCARNSPPRHAR